MITALSQKWVIRHNPKTYEPVYKQKNQYFQLNIRPHIFIHEEFISPINYHHTLSHKNFIVKDDFKVVGYLINGKYFDVKNLY